MNTITVKAQAQNQTVAEHKVVTQNGNPTVIEATDKVNYELLDESTGQAPDYLVTKRVDQDLHVSFESDSLDPDLIVEGFYDDVDSALVGVAEDGSYYYYIPDSGEVGDYVTELAVGDVQGQALGGNPQATPWWVGATEAEGFAALPWLAGLAGVGVIGAAVGSSSDSNDNNQQPEDDIAPEAPTDVVVSDDGSTVTGTGEAGTSVEVTDPEGNVIGEGVVNDNGDFNVGLEPPQVDGEEIEVTLTDPAGNTSDSTKATAPDTTAPDAPTDNFIITDNVANDGSGDVLDPPEVIQAGDVTNDNTPSITIPSDTLGTDETAQLLVDGEEVKATVVENTDGSITLTPDNALTDGAHDLSYNLKDAAGNASANGPEVSITVDTTAPDTPTNVDISDDGNTVTGTGEAGTSVEVTNPEGNVIGEGVVDDNGDFNVGLEPPQVDGEEIEVTLTDPAGNTSDSTKATAPDTTAPDAPTNNFIITDNVANDGSGDVLDPPEEIQEGDVTNDNTPSIKIPSGTLGTDETAQLLVDGEEVEATVVENTDGSITLTPDNALTDGAHDLSYNLKDAAGNASANGPVVSITVDTTAPDMPTNVDISDDGNTVTGTGEAAASVEITDPEGNVIGKGEVDDNGDFNVGLVPPQVDGEEIEVTLTDPAGNTSEPTNVNAPDTTDPSAPTSIVVGNDDSFLNDDEVDADGNVEAVIGLPSDTKAGDTVVVNGQEQTLTADDITAEAVTVEVAAPAEGESLDIVASIKDTTGNESLESKKNVGVVDTTAPDTPTNVDVIDDGNTVTGNGEAGASVEVTDPEGNVVGKGEVDDNGDFNVGLVPPQVDGEEVEVTLTDPAGNTSEPTNVNAPDIGEPDTPSAPTSIVVGNDDSFLNDDEVDADGNVEAVIGLPSDTKAGDTVVVNGQEQTLTADDITAEAVTVEVAAPAEGASLDIVASIKDTTGNESLESKKNVGVVDTTAPDTPTNVDVIDDGNTVTGNGEAGASVEVTDPEGNVIGKGEVDDNGDFNVGLVPPQVDGEEIEVTLTDPAGNTSEPTNATAPDTTAPGEQEGATQVAPIVVIPEAEDGINAIELADGIQTQVTLPSGTLEGDTVILTVTPEGGDPREITHTVTASEAAAGESEVIISNDTDGISADGEYTVTAMVTDATGNNSEPSDTVAVTVDTTAPDAPTNDFTITDNVANDGSGDVLDPPEEIQEGDVTNDNTPSITIPSGALGTDETAQLLVDDEEVEATVVENTDGSISLTPDNALTDGAHDLSYNLKDAAGNASANGPEVSITVDTTAPGEQEGATQVAPVIAIPEAEDGINADEIADGIRTQITLPTGTLEGDTVTLTVIPEGGDSREVTHTVTASEAATGESEVIISNDATGITEDGDYSVVATVTDQAGNSSVPSDSFDFTVDTVAELTVDTPIAGDDIVNADEAEDGFDITGTGTAGDTITITDSADNQVGSAVVGANGKWSIGITQQDIDDMNQGSETLEITATDPAGNESSETANITIVPATALTITTPIAGDNLVNADEAEVGFNVTGTGAVGDTITLTNQAGDLIGTAEVGANNRWSIAVDPAQVDAMGEGDERLTATSTVNSDTTSTTITIDTAAPDDTTTDIVVDDVTADNVINAIEAEGNIAVTGSVTGDYSEGDALTITVNGIEYAGAVDFAGRFSIDVPGTELVADADNTIEVSIIATDEAGNTGIVTATKEYTVNTDEIIAAADNFVDLQLDATPDVINNGTKTNTTFDFANVGLGPVLNVGALAQLGDNALTFDVGENEVRQVTMYGDAEGINAAATFDLFVYKLNESTNQYEQQAVEDAWVVAYLFGGESEKTEFSLTEGKWVFVMAPGEGVEVLSGYSIKVTEDNTLDYTSVSNVSGSTSGNVLTDDNVNFGVDQLPEGTLLTSVDGVEVPESGTTTIEGQYGNLTIASDGSYTYVVNEGFTDIGSEESFTYVVTSPVGNIDSAELNIELTLFPDDQRIEIDETVIVNAEPELVFDTDKSNIDKVIGFSLVNVDFLGPVLGADALSGEGTMEFSVGENQVRELTFFGDGGGVVSVGAQHDLFVYKLNEETGQYEQVHAEENWFTTIVGGSRSKELELQFTEGEYRAILVPRGGVNLISGSGLEVVRDKLYDYDNPTTFSGSINEDATEDDATELLAVDGQQVEAGETITVQGDYGTITINSDGTYTYNVDKPADAGPDWKPPYGKIDSFQVVTKDAGGKTEVDKLNIKISTHTATDDFNAATVNEVNVTSDIQFNRDYKPVGNYGDDITQNFEITANKEASATLEIQSSAKNVTYTLTNTTTGQVFTKTVTGDKGISLTESLADLPAGNYTLNMQSSGGFAGGNIKGYQFKVDLVHLDEFEATTPNELMGDLLANDTSLTTDIISELEVGGLNVFVSDPNKGADSIQVDGQYGTLTVFKDGSYEYIPNGDLYGIERFTYETTSKVGVKETATLEINVGKNITASIYDDIAISSAADDSFTMGEGADTVIFDNLGGTEGGNGRNGLDTWSDFNADQGDKIDITSLLDGNQTQGNIDNYLKYEDGELMVDRNGNAEFEGLLNVDATDLDGLLGSVEWQSDTVEISAFSMRAAGDEMTGLNSDLSSSPMEVNEAFDSDTTDLSEDGQNIGLSDIIETEVIDIASSSDEVSEQNDNGQSHIAQSTDHGSQNHGVWQVDSPLSSQAYIDPEVSNVI